MAVVYRHIRLDKKEPFYIGIGKTIKRAFEKKDRSSAWKGIISRSEYEVDILFEDLTWEEACIKEKEFIQLYGRKQLSTGTLVNLTEGGDGVVGNTMSEEAKNKIRIANSGVNGPLYGRVGHSHPKYGTKASEHTLELKRANNPLSQPILQFDKVTGAFIKEFRSVREVTRNGFNNRAVQNCAAGRTSSSGGYIWKYKNKID